MRLIISGGGSIETSKKVDEFFIELLPKNPRILYVPHAMRFKKSFEECKKWFSTFLNQFRIADFELVEDISQVTLDQYDAIYIGGGNTFNLLKEIKKTGFDKKLFAFLQNEGIVYGGSAGGIVLGKTISYCGDENKLDQIDLEGLDCVKGYSFMCHFSNNTTQNGLALGEIPKRLIFIPQSSGIYYDGKKIKILGNQQVSVYKDQTKVVLSPGDIFTP